MNAPKMTPKQQEQCIKWIVGKELTQAEAARRYGVSTRTVWQLVKAKETEAV
jgi:predicted DNA-binding protein (UPF0251 family)